MFKPNTLLDATQSSAANSLPSLPVNTPKQLATGEAKPVGAYNPSSMLRLAISIKAPKMAEEEEFLKELQDRNSPNFHKYMTPKQWNARFAPSAQDEQAVVDWVKSQGLTVTARYPNRLMVDAEGTVDAIQKAFNVNINRYEVNGAVEFSNDRDPQIPSNLAGIVQYIDGLNSILRMRPANSQLKGMRGPDYSPGPVRQEGPSGHQDADPAAAEALKSSKSSHQTVPLVTNGFYDPSDIWSSDMYDFNALQAQGHCCNPTGNAGGTSPQTSIGLATDADFADSDIVGFHNQYPYLAGHWFRHWIDGTPSCCGDESTLDTEWTLATSNSRGSYLDTSSIHNYEAAKGFGSFGDVFNQMVTDNVVKVVNISYGLPEDYLNGFGLVSAWHAIFNQMLGQGMTIMAAAGDSGASAGCGNALAVLYPESDPDVVSVGGTQLALNGDGSFNSEVTWTGDTFTGACSGNDGGTGGGCSNLFAAPGYQSSPACGAGSRSVPDIALNASPHSAQNYYFGGSLQGVAGTSIASPMMSGFVAQANAYLLAIGLGGSPLGQLDYVLYYEGYNKGGPYASPHFPYYDVLTGCNSNDITFLYGLGSYCAGTGYDLTTGWGSFNALQLSWAINSWWLGAFVAPTVTFSGPFSGANGNHHWYSTDQTVSWTVTSNAVSGLTPTGVAGYSAAWDSYFTDPFSEPTPGSGNAFYSGPQSPNQTTGSLDLASAGQGCHFAGVDAWDNAGYTPGEQFYYWVCFDTISPVTTASLKGTVVSGTNYKSAVQVTLSATDSGYPSTGSGVANTVYQVNSEGQHTYSGPFTVSYPGSYTVTFHSTDVAGNVESTKSVSFTISSVLAMSPASLAFGNQPIATSSASKTVTLKNISAVAVPLTSITPSGDFSIPSKTCGASLAAGASCTFAVQFKPSVVGGVSGEVTVVFPGEGSPQRLALSGAGIGSITLSPTSLAFGSIAVGSTSLTKPVTLTNNESTALSISEAASGDYSIASTTCGASLAAHASCTINVNFHPKQNGSVIGDLAVTYNAALSPQEVSLSGTGTGGPPAPLTFTPSLLSFGKVAAGSSLIKTVVVKNNSASSVTISAVSANGDFKATGCVTTLAPLGTCTMTVTFKPSAKGTIYGAVSLTDNTTVSPETYEVLGVGVSPLTASVSTLAFGTANVGTTSASQSVTLTNNLASALSLTMAVSGDFARSGGSCGASLAAHASCTILLNFTPTATGAIKGVVTITYPSTYSPEEVALTGTGN